MWAMLVARSCLGRLRPFCTAFCGFLRPPRGSERVKSWLRVRRAEPGLPRPPARLPRTTTTPWGWRCASAACASHQPLGVRLLRSSRWPLVLPWQVSRGWQLCEPGWSWCSQASLRVQTGCGPSRASAPGGLQPQGAPSVPALGLTLGAPGLHPHLGVALQRCCLCESDRAVVAQAWTSGSARGPMKLGPSVAGPAA